MLSNGFWSLWSSVAMNAEDGAGAGGEAGADSSAGNEGAGEAKAPESVLFPDEGGEKKEDEKPAGEEAEGEKSDSEGEGEEKKDEEKKSDDPADKVPDDGKYDLKMPEGIELDTELLDALGPEFKDLGLTQKQAQQLADKFSEVQQKRAEKIGERWAKTINEWVDQAKSDEEIGGDKWDSTVQSGRRAVDRLGTPALKEFLNASGGGNHPEVIRFMAKVGAMIKEDNPASGGAEGAGRPADPAHLLFPNDAPKG